jgi:Na+/H+ antiporter NhaA
MADSAAVADDAATSTAERARGFSERTAWARNLAAPVRSFLSTETGSAVVLVAGAVAALIWANSPWSSSYESVWRTTLSIKLGSAGVATDLRHWINEGLMTFFFLVVGLEAKREFDLGELRERSRVAIPVIAAIGGAGLSVAVYLAFNAGRPSAHGWGAAMSSDTALVLGALALLTPRAATRLRVFLLTLAVVDDLIALLVIVIVYTSHVSFPALGAAAGFFIALLALRYAPLPVRRPLAMGLGVALWVAMFKSGVDPVVAGLAVGLATSAYPPAREDLERATELTRSFREQPTPELARSAQLSVLGAISLNDRLQYALHPWTSYVFVPLFALANAGVHVSGGLLEAAISSPITLGILLGYAVGKPLGIMGSSWLASRPALGGRRPSLSWPALAGGAQVAGIGFTVSLLISDLAFHNRDLQEAQLGVIASVIVAPLLAWGVFAIYRRLPTQFLARQIGSTPGDVLDLTEDVDPERDHIRGPDDAPVTLVEYGDFQCPYCGQAESVIRELLSSFGGDLRYVWRHLPLNDVHNSAQLAAEASEAAASQGRFWDMYDALLNSQDELTPKHLSEIATELGLDVDRFREALRERKYAERVSEDVSSADSSGVSGTPTFFINGRRHYGAYDIDTLTEEVRAALRRVKQLATARPTEQAAA